MPNELQLFAILVFVAVFMGINLGLWLWSNRRRHDRLTLAVEDQTPDHAMSDLADIFGGWMCTCGQGSWTTYGCTAGDDLMAVVDAVAEIRTDCTCPWNNGYARPGTSLTHATWCPAYDVHAAARTAGMAGHYTAEPKPTFGQERLYDAEGLVQYGLSMVHRACSDARRDAATDHVCQPCGKVFAAVTA